MNANRAITSDAHLLIACYEAVLPAEEFLDAIGRFSTPLGRTARYQKKEQKKTRENKRIPG